MKEKAARLLIRADRAILLSLVFHAVLLIIAIGAGSPVSPARNVLVIDFSMEQDESAAAAPEYKHKRVAREKPLPVRADERPRPPASPDKAAAVQSDMSASSPPAPVSQPLQQAVSTAVVPDKVAAVTSRAASSPAGDTARTEGGRQAAADTGNTRESMKKRYLAEHFAYIRDTVLRKLSYPPVARRMGWSGRVMLSFCVTQDGLVNGIRVLQSSGVDILDKSAVEAVRKAAPFPKPPAEAEVVIPVVYRLD